MHRSVWNNEHIFTHYPFTCILNDILYTEKKWRLINWYNHVKKQYFSQKELKLSEVDRAK